MARGGSKPGERRGGRRPGSRRKLILAGDKITALGKDRLAELDEWAYGVAKKYAPKEDEKGRPYWDHDGDETRFMRFLNFCGRCAAARAQFNQGGADGTPVLHLPQNLQARTDWIKWNEAVSDIPTAGAGTRASSRKMRRTPIRADVGSLTVFMFVGDPGVYWLDMWKRKPASDAQAKAAFGIEAFNRYRAQAVELDDDRRIEAALAAPQPEPQSEDLKAKVRRLVREQEKRVQAAADRQRTSWLDQEPPDSVLIPSPLS